MKKLRIKKIIALTIFSIVILFSNVIILDCDWEYMKFTDARDGRKYKYVKIGKQIWMAENLGYNVPGSSCYKNNLDNCQKYGRLYNWAAASNVCPDGWHLPTDEEWTSLTDFIGSISIAGRKLKAKYGWDDHNDESGNGSDNYEFSALPSGYGYFGAFYDLGLYGYWWSATENTPETAYYRDLYFDYEDIGRDEYDKAFSFAVRCVKSETVISGYW